jgi:poly(A) polymerase
MTEKEKALHIVETLRNEGRYAVLAGGCVRDMLLGIKPKDYDIATEAYPDEVEALFPNTKAVGKAFGVVLVNIEGADFEVATFRSDGEYLDGRRPSTVHFSSIEEDAKRRDFTVNALFYDPLDDKVIDFVGGMADLENKVLRFVGDPEERIEEDKLRLLRFVRFLLKLKFQMDEKSFMAVRMNAPAIFKVSSERIREELMKMLEVGQPRKMVQLLMQTHLMELILPEVAALDGCEQDPIWHPEIDTLVHTIMVMENLKDEHPLLQLAAMFHDVGKPTTMEVRDGRITNRGHASVGKEMTEKRMRELKFSNDEIDLVASLVHHHMKGHVAPHMRKSKLKRLLAEPWAEMLIKLAMADQKASHGDTNGAEFLKEKFETWEPEEIKPEPLVNGHDLIELGFKPGPIFSKILDTVSDEQLEGNLNTREEAIAFVKHNYV